MWGRFLSAGRAKNIRFVPDSVPATQNGHPDLGTSVLWCSTSPSPGVLDAKGWSKANLVGVEGIEPSTNRL